MEMRAGRYRDGKVQKTGVCGSKSGYDVERSRLRVYMTFNGIPTQERRRVNNQALITNVRAYS
jgi:hypothetical protein